MGARRFQRMLTATPQNTGATGIAVGMAAGNVAWLHSALSGVSGLFGCGCGCGGIGLMFCQCNPEVSLAACAAYRV